MILENFIIEFSYVAIFLLLYINGIIGAPSSQIICIIAGWFAFKGSLNIQMIVIIGILAYYLGNITLYELSRIKGMKYVKRLDNFMQKYLNSKVFSTNNIKKIELVMKKYGLLYLLFGKLVNPIKIVINIPAGLAKINRFYFTLIILFTSAIWITGFTMLGYFFGKNFEFAIYYAVIMLTLSVIIIVSFRRAMNLVDIEIDK